MRARAPGKLVLSGAYSVLEGATSLVAAVDRYVVADAAAPAELLTDEVREAMAAGALRDAPWFDASALREVDATGSSRKLGLGSSAAILVASMAACAPRAVSSHALAVSLFADALRIHRAAQGGGSGVDVAASCFGGVSACHLTEGGLAVAPHEIPSVTFEAWACPASASTSAMLACIRRFAATDGALYRAVLARAAEAANTVAAASTQEAFIDGIRAQRSALAELGRRAGVDIMTPDVDALHAVATETDAVFYPAGAGGGDIALYLGVDGSTPHFRARAVERGLRRVELRIGAPGVAQA